MSGRRDAKRVETRRDYHIRLRLLLGAVGAVSDAVGHAMDTTPDVHTVLKGTAVRRHRRPDVHVPVCGEKRN